MLDLESDEGAKDNVMNNYILALTIESVPSSSMITYLAFCTLFSLYGSLLYSKEGFLRKYLDANSAFFPESSTAWIGYGLDGFEAGLSAFGSAFSTSKNSNPPPA